MARPLKRRNICSLPESNRFGPLNTHRDPKETVRMTVDEYEAIRLIDLEGFTQEECAEQMGVARSTVQGIYLEARKKLAEVLVNGKLLFIEGGEYRLCEGSGTACGRACRRHRLGLCFATEKTVRPDPNTNERRTPMKIAIPVEENTLDAKVSSSFGRAAYFLIFDTQSDEARFIDTAAGAKRRRCDTSRGHAGLSVQRGHGEREYRSLLCQNTKGSGRNTRRFSWSRKPGINELPF